ncbi:LuxR C-terminal-related transcriptional regulator [Flexivirga sp. B27]
MNSAKPARFPEAQGPSAQPRVVVLSPSALHREALVATLTASGVFGAVEERSDGVAPATYDVAVVDLPALGLTAVREIVRVVPTLAWGGYLHGGAVAELVDAGLRGYVSVIGSQRDLVVAAARVAAGELWLPELESKTIRLTPAEQRVCRAYLVELADVPRSLVAAELGISERTLKVHLANVRAKVNSTAANRVELARHLRARGALLP